MANLANILDEEKKEEKKEGKESARTKGTRGTIPALLLKARTDAHTLYRIKNIVT